MYIVLVENGVTYPFVKMSNYFRLISDDEQILIHKGNLKMACS